MPIVNTSRIPEIAVALTQGEKQWVGVGLIKSNHRWEATFLILKPIPAQQDILRSQSAISSSNAVVIFFFNNLSPIKDTSHTQQNAHSPPQASNNSLPSTSIDARHREGRNIRTAGDQPTAAGLPSAEISVVSSADNRAQLGSKRPVER